MEVSNPGYFHGSMILILKSGKIEATVGIYNVMRCRGRGRYSQPVQVCSLYGFVCCDILFLLYCLAERTKM